MNRVAGAGERSGGGTSVIRAASDADGGGSRGCTTG